MKTPARPPFTVGRADVNVVTLSHEFARSGAEFWVLLRADAHWDNPHCRRDVEKRHLDQARERGAAIIDIGDLFCAMQGKYDKRSDKSCVRPEHQHGDYLDRLITTAADYYQPYARNFVLMAPGNHESAIRARHETDLTQRLVACLNDRAGSSIQANGYSGWCVFRFGYKGCHCSAKLWYIHGYGGGGPATADMIQAHRQASYVEMCDVMASSHTHDSWSRRLVKIGLDHAGRVQRKDVRYIKVGTYKDEYGDGRGGWQSRPASIPSRSALTGSGSPRGGRAMSSAPTSMCSRRRERHRTWRKPGHIRPGIGLASVPVLAHCRHGSKPG